MIVTTTESLPGYEITKVCGFVDGSSICVANSSSPTTVMGFSATKKFDSRKIADSHINQMPNSINDAIDDMIRRAKDVGADVIIGVKVSPIRGSEIHRDDRGSAGGGGTYMADAFITMYVYGTAVRIQKLAVVARGGGGGNRGVPVGSSTSLPSHDNGRDAGGAADEAMGEALKVYLKKNVDPVGDE